MSVNIGNTTDAFQTGGAEKNDETFNGVSSDFIEERFRANLKTLDAHN